MTLHQQLIKKEQLNNDDAYKMRRAANNLAKWDELFAKYPANTRRAYMSDMADYQEFCKRFGYDYITTDFELAKQSYMKYVDELVASHLTRATIERRLATLSVLMQICELPNPVKVSKYVADHTKLCLRDKPKAQRQASPLRIEDMEYINEHFEVASLKDLRDLLAINIAFSALLRAEELCSIEHKHISERDNTLFIPKRKNDQDGEGGYSHLSDECLELYRQWKKESGKSVGYVFRSMNKGSAVLDTHIQYQTYLNAMRNVLIRCGMDASQYSTHSFRVGAVVSMAEAGLDGFEIQMSGGWNDPKMVARYSRQAQMKHAGIAKLIKSRKG